MKSAALWALIVLNAVLLLSFVNRVTGGGNVAMAQNAARNRPGDYLMIPTEIQGSTNGVVMVVDQTEGTMSAFSYDDANNRFDAMPKLDLQRMFNPQGGAPAGRGGR
jgi:hypothetical protein